MKNNATSVGALFSVRWLHAALNRGHPARSETHPHAAAATRRTYRWLLEPVLPLIERCKNRCWVCCGGKRTRRDVRGGGKSRPRARSCTAPPRPKSAGDARSPRRSEEHTSELQSHLNLVCRLLL